LRWSSAALPGRAGLPAPHRRGESGRERPRYRGSPPGKKLQNVLLLSGGEKSLTALPVGGHLPVPASPSARSTSGCGAGRDNVGRFADLLHSLSRETQFLLVTHSKRMMQTADMIYGVTMQEPASPRCERALGAASSSEHGITQRRNILAKCGPADHFSTEPRSIKSSVSDTA